MPEGPDGKTIIIVKKVSGHGGHHGGAWKVAYADFVTAMMCLFLVLWLVNSASEPTRQRVASYFGKPGIFQKGSGTPLEIGGGGILPETFAPPAEENSQVMIGKKIYGIDARTGKVKDYFDPGGAGDPKEEGALGGGKGQGDYKESNPQIKEAKTEKKIDVAKLRSELEQAVAQGEQQMFDTGEESKDKGSNSIGQVAIKIDQRGLLIEIMDTESASMFELGSSKILPQAREQLIKIGEVLRKLPNPIDIEGHTDARPYRGRNAGDYDNWNLALDRANAARRALEESGFERSKVARVVSYADQRPKVLEDPLDPSNRRITISMRFSEQAKSMLQGTQTVETKPKPFKKSDSASGAKKVSALPTPQPTSPELDDNKGEEENSVEPVKGESKTGPEVPAPKKEKELDVKIETTLPEGPRIYDNENEHSKSPPIEKDKIFGSKNPFFLR